MLAFRDTKCDTIWPVQEKQYILDKSPNYHLWKKRDSEAVVGETFKILHFLSVSIQPLLLYHFFLYFRFGPRFISLSLPPMHRTHPLCPPSPQFGVWPPLISFYKPPFGPCSFLFSTSSSPVQAWVVSAYLLLSVHSVPIYPFLSLFSSSLHSVPTHPLPQFKLYSFAFSLVLWPSCSHFLCIHTPLGVPRYRLFLQVHGQDAGSSLQP